MNGCDPNSVMAVLPTLLIGQTDVRFSIDPKANSLVVLARPAQQATILAAVLSQMQHEGIRVEVIRLKHVDPQRALDAINRLFSSGDPKQPATNVPQVDAAGDAGGAGSFELDGDRGERVGDGAGQAADDGLAGDGAVFVVVSQVGVEVVR